MAYFPLRNTEEFSTVNSKDWGCAFSTENLSVFSPVNFPINFCW